MCVAATYLYVKTLEHETHRLRALARLGCDNVKLTIDRFDPATYVETARRLRVNTNNQRQNIAEFISQQNTLRADVGEQIRALEQAPPVVINTEPLHKYIKLQVANIAKTNALRALYPSKQYLETRFSEFTTTTVDRLKEVTITYDSLTRHNTLRMLAASG